MSPDSRCYTARYVFPVSELAIPNGVVVVRGTRIEAIEPRGRFCDIDFGNSAIIPGLVNAHTHLDLSGARGLIPPTDPDHFTDWLRGVIAYRRTRTPEQVQSDIRTGLAECLSNGTTLIGDIASEGASWDSVANADVRAVVYHEMLGLSEQRANAAGIAAQRWVDSHRGNNCCMPGYSPHAPYSARWTLCCGSDSMNARYSLHLAESPGEMELLQNHSGPFLTFLNDLGVWDVSGVGGLSQLLTPSRLIGNYLFVHGNYLPYDCCEYLTGLHSIAYCPRTHAAFGHPPHPFREFRKRGVRVCLGTDSLASNPDLDILAEARFVHRRYPEIPGSDLLRMVTLAGAEALGWANEAGSLEPGKSADFVVIPLPDVDIDDPHELLFAQHPGIRFTYFRGEQRGVEFNVDLRPSTNS